MKKTMIALIVISMAAAVCGCNTETTKSTSEVSQGMVSQDSVDNGVSENEPVTIDHGNLYSSDDSEDQPSDAASEASSGISEVSQDSEEQSSYSELSAQQLKEKLKEMFTDQNLGVIYRALSELYGKDYVKTKIEYYDCVNGKTIIEKDNWTIREWSFSDDKLRLGCEKTTFGIGSLKNALDSITNSDAYQAVSKISDIVETAKNLGILKDN